MGSLLARAYKRILSGKLAQDAGEHWVTVNAGSKEGGEGGGSHVLLDGEGRVVAGMGGKFKGQNIDRIERKKFINQNAWNRQRKALTEKAGDDTQLKRVVTAGMRSQAEKEADKSNDTWQKEGLYNALVRRTQRENRGMINVLHDHLDYKNAQPKTPNPIAEKIQKQSDGVKQIVTEAITKYNDLEAVNQLHDIPDGVNVVTEKGQFFKTGDLWSSPDGKKTLENDQMFRQLKKELKSQISNKDMDNLMANELEKVQYKDVAERVKDIDPQLAKEIENTEKKYNKLKAENIAKAERSAHEKKRGGGHAISFEEQNTEKKLQELKAQAEAKIAEAPKAEEQPKGKLYDYHEVTNLSDKAYKERAKLVKEMRNLNVNNPGEELTISKYGRTFKRIPDLEGNINTNWGEVGRTGEIYKREYAYKAAPDNNEEREEYKNWKERRAQWLRNAGIDPSDIDNRPLYFYDKATNTESFYNAYDPNGTWSKYDDNLPEKDYKFFKEAKQRAKDAGLEVKDGEEQPEIKKQPEAKKKPTVIASAKSSEDIANTIKENINGAMLKKLKSVTTLREELDKLPNGTFISHGNYTFEKVPNGWKNGDFVHDRIDGTEIEKFFDNGNLKLGIGKTPEEAKSSIKTSQIFEVKPQQETAPKVEEPKDFSKPITHEDGHVSAHTGEINEELAKRAYYWTSHDPEGRGKRAMQEYAQEANSLYDRLKKQVKTPEQQAFLNEAFETAKKKLADAYNTALSAESRTASSMITGPSRFNVKQQEQRRNTAEARWKEAWALTDKLEESISKGIYNRNTAEEKQRLNDEPYLDKIKGIKYSMEKGNSYSAALMKSELYKSLEAKARAGKVEELGRLMQAVKDAGIYTNRHSVWQLPALAQQRAEKNATNATRNANTYKGVNIERNTDINRLQLKFDERPTPEQINDLKRSGWRWSPHYQAWQRQITDNAERSMSNFLDKHFKKEEAQQTQAQPRQATPTAQPRQATPTQQAEGKQYHGTGIENKNGRYEVSFNEFPSYKLRTDMKNNGFRWDPNAKVWHTTDREKLDQVMSKHFTERT